MKPSTYLLTLIALSGVLTVYVLALTGHGDRVGDGLGRAWMIVFTLLVVLWTLADQRAKAAHVPLDFSLWFLVFWPIALPIYLIRTRGVEGLVCFVGFVALYCSPTVFAALMTLALFHGYR